MVVLLFWNFIPNKIMKAFLKSLAWEESKLFSISLSCSQQKKWGVNCWGWLEKLTRLLRLAKEEAAGEKLPLSELQIIWYQDIQGCRKDKPVMMQSSENLFQLIGIPGYWMSEIRQNGATKKQSLAKDKQSLGSQRNGLGFSLWY